MSVSDRLRSKIAIVWPAFGATAWQIWDSPNVSALYAEYLCTMHCIVRSSVPLMQAAISRSLELEDDPVAVGIAAYLSDHVGEEAGHDEWILEDLEATGRDRAEPMRRIPPPCVASVVGSQYYWIRHHHPVALLGHIAVMEGYPPSVELAEHLQERTGYGPDAFRSLARHAMLDIHHRDEFLAMLDELPLAQEHEALLGVSALHTIRGLIEVFEQILEHEPAAVEAAT
jgi:hypothetical protein